MSTYTRETRHPKTGKWSVATWRDDYFGNHNYGVDFDGEVFDERDHIFETRDPLSPPTEEVQEKCKIESCKGKENCLQHCPCNCHSRSSAPDTVQGWEERFSKKFTDNVLSGGFGNDLIVDQATPIMKFISKERLLAQQQLLRSILEKKYHDAVEGEEIIAVSDILSTAREYGVEI